MNPYSKHENFEQIMDKIQALCPDKRLTPLRAEIVSECYHRRASSVQIATSILRLIEKGSDLDELVGHLRELGRWM